MNVIKCIKTRRSVRMYNNKPIEDEVINSIIESAIWTPSGKNGQPWRFHVITDPELIDNVSKLSVYYSWLKTATVLIVIFLDHTHSYNYVKDVQSCGAAIQNMLLTSHALRVGSCWIGEIIDRNDEVKKVLGINDMNYR